jgi:hypothetical protein
MGTVDPRVAVGRVWVQLSSLMQDSITQAIPINGGISNLDFIYEKLIFLVLVG